MFIRITTILVMMALAACAHATPLGNPYLTVQEPGFGTWVFTEIESPLVVVEAAGGTPLEFTWSADASWYGGTIAGYRYGLDLMDPDDVHDPGWTTPDFVPDLLAADPIDFPSGVHTLHIMVVDEEGSWTRAGFLLDFTAPVSNQRLTWGALKSMHWGGPR